MKYAKKILLLSIILFSFTGCNIKSEEKLMPGTINGKSNKIITDSNITLELENNTLSSTGATFILTNNSDNSVFFDSIWVLEKEEDGVWYNLKTFRKMIYALNITQLNSRNSKHFNINWELWYGNLPQGKYRFIKNISFDENDSDIFHLSSEFYIQ